MMVKYVWIGENNDVCIESLVEAFLTSKEVQVALETQQHDSL